MIAVASKRRRDGHGSAVFLERALRRLQHLDDAQSVSSVGERLPPLTDAVEEVLAFQLERLGPPDLGERDVAQTHGGVFFGSGVVGRVVGALFIKSQIFSGAQIM